MYTRLNTAAENGKRELKVEEITCKKCGDKQEAQTYSFCHRSRVCIDCANKVVKQKRFL